MDDKDEMGKRLKRGVVAHPIFCNERPLWFGINQRCGQIYYTYIDNLCLSRSRSRHEVSREKLYYVSSRKNRHPAQRIFIYYCIRHQWQRGLWHI